jgi:hypothetical protein
MKSKTDILLKEHEILRAELQTLKHCQLQYFWSSVMATGVILGVGPKLAEGAAVNSQGGAMGATFYVVLFCLAPLAVIIPCWLVFFDKATSITRIVGYYRLLEYKTLTPRDRVFAYVGWENALRLYRNRQVESAPSLGTRLVKYVVSSVQGIVSLSDFQAIHRYWNLTWATFFLLAILCITLAFAVDVHGYAADLRRLLLILVVLAANHTLYLLYHLTKGKLSYDHHERNWRSILASAEAKGYLATFPPKRKSGKRRP